MRVKRKKQAKALTPEQKRKDLYDRLTVAFDKLNKGEPITEKEARILQKCHNTFMELYNIFKPTIKRTLIAQSSMLADAIEELSE